MTKRRQREYEVDRILDKRNANTSAEYLIKWKNYPTHSSTWEPVQNLDNCSELIAEFEIRLNGQNSKWRVIRAGKAVFSSAKWILGKFWWLGRRLI